MWKCNTSYNVVYIAMTLPQSKTHFPFRNIFLHSQFCNTISDKLGIRIIHLNAPISYEYYKMGYENVF